MPDRLRSAAVRRRLSMTSLIDVIFLLLLFFMLSSTFARQGELPLDLAMGGAVSPSETPPRFLQLRPEGMRLDSEAVALPDLQGALAADTEGLLLVSMAPGVTSQQLAEVLHMLRDLSGWRVAVLGATP